MLLRIAYRENNATGLINKLTGKTIELMLVTSVDEKNKQFFGYSVDEEGVEHRWYDIDGWELIEIGNHKIHGYLRTIYNADRKILGEKYNTANFIADALNLDIWIKNNYTVFKAIRKLTGMS